MGSGIAGLSFALKVAKAHPERTITILTKADKSESNTRYAQGGVAAVSDFSSDNFENHINDTLIAGDGLCAKDVVDMVVRTGPAMVNDLINWGAEFDATKDGTLDLGKEGGHSRNRVVHHKDTTGFSIMEALVKSAKRHSNIEILEQHFALELITEHHLHGKVIDEQNLTCFGIYALNTENMQVEVIQSSITLLATGGLGQVYMNTTNPAIATGDGIAMAYRAKARISDMEFIQFHPTALYDPGASPAFLITEAIRGLGAIIRNKKGSAFMEAMDKRGSLAPRDIVARAIDSEMKRSGEDHVYLDCTQLNKEALLNKFPNIIQKCKEKGIDLFKEYIPVVPAAHYCCGGIDTDIDGRTTITDLYACGECARTGLHGANRLASNSLLEAIVFADRCFMASEMTPPKDNRKMEIPSWSISGIADSKEAVLVTHNQRELQNIMSDYVGIYRSMTRLQRASERLKILFIETEKLYDKATVTVPLCELRNQIAVGYLIISAAMKRKKNVGLHFVLDE